MAISATLARSLFGSADVIGREIVFDDSLGHTSAAVVAVVDDTKTTRVADGPQFHTYTPRLSSPRMAITVRLRGEATPGDVKALQAVARELDPEVPADFTRLADIQFAEASLPALRTGLLIAFAGQAVLIAAISVLGLVRWLVAQRGPELAMRVALGSTPTMLRRLLLRTEMAWVFVGIATGTAGVFIAAPTIGSILIFVDPRDPGILVSVIALLSTIVLVSVTPVAKRIANNPSGLITTLRDAAGT